MHLLAKPRTLDWWNDEIEIDKTAQWGRKYVVNSRDEIIRQECTGCHQMLPASEFVKNRWHSRGLMAECKTCACERAKKMYERDPINFIVKEIRNRSARKNFPCDITPEFIKELYKKQKGRCFYTGLEFGEIGKDTTLSIDRVDSKQGYVMGNVVLCCVWVNVMKSNYSLKDFLARIKVISESTPKILEDFSMSQELGDPNYGHDWFGTTTLP